MIDIGDVTRRAREINAILGGSGYFDAINVAARSTQQLLAAIEAARLDEARAAQQIRAAEAERWARQQEELMHDALERARSVIHGTPIQQQLLREMEQLESLRAQLAAQVRHAADVARPFAADLSGLPDERLRIRELLIPQVSASAISAAISAFPPRGFMDDLLGQGAIAAAMNSLRSAMEARSVERIAQALDLMEVGVEETIEAEPANLQLRMFLAQLVLDILLFVFQMLYGDHQAQLAAVKAAESEARMMEQFRLLNERLDDSDDCEREHRGFGFYRVERRAPLVQKPRAKERAPAWIEPGALLRVLEDRDTWVHVEFPEARPGTPREGWIRRKYLGR